MARPKKPHATSHARLDVDYVKQCARGNWQRIVSEIGKVDIDLLGGEHGPCPKCGGDSKADRFRFSDLNGDGGAICNKCGKFGDGFALLEFLTGLKFYELLTRVAELLGLAPMASSSPTPGSKPHAKNSASNPAEHLRFLEWNETLASIWCLSKPPIIPAAILAIGGKRAIYRGHHPVIALPVWGEKLNAADPVGYVIYALSGGTLTVGKGDKSQQVKIKTVEGSQPGWIGPVAKLTAAREVWKLEGPSDLLAFYSLPDVPADTIAITNFAGASERPSKWMLELLAGKIVRLLHDADKGGEEGISGTEKNGKRLPGWGELVASYASETYHARLPYDIRPDHGRDARDYLSELKHSKDSNNGGLQLFGTDAA
jgi:hypothetical protein